MPKMHTAEAGNVPAFLVKLWKLVEDPSCNDLICWSSNGSSFCILDQTRFAKELLPLYFKHSNMASFIRQLNMYGFRKVVSIEQGGLRSIKEEMEFQHQYFLKGQEYLLELVKRKIPTSKPSEEEKVKPAILNKMISDVKNMRGRQEHMDSKLTKIKRENEALWRELASLRQKHIHQQEIVKKLIQFLISLVQPNRGIGVKRKYPLMINDTLHVNNSKSARLTGRHISYDGSKSDENLGINSSGPVIQEIQETVYDPDEYFVKDNISLKSNNSKNDTSLNDSFDVSSMIAKASSEGSSDANQFYKDFDSSSVFNPEEINLFSGQENDGGVNPVVKKAVDFPIIESPSPEKSNTEAPLLPVDELINAVIDNDNMQLETVANSDALAFFDSKTDKQADKNELVDHLGIMQNDIDSIKELLSSSGCTIDASYLLGLFNMDDSLTNKILSGQENPKKSDDEVLGMALTQYQPNLLELTDDDSIFFDTENLPTTSSDDLSTPLFELADCMLEGPGDKTLIDNQDLQTEPIISLPVQEDEVESQSTFSSPANIQSVPQTGKRKRNSSKKVK